MKNMQERKNSLEQLFSEKAKELQNIENRKSELTSDLLQLKGKIDLLKEMIKEDQNSENTPKSVTHTEKNDTE